MKITLFLAVLSLIVFTSCSHCRWAVKNPERAAICAGIESNSTDTVTKVITERDTIIEYIPEESSLAFDINDFDFMGVATIESDNITVSAAGGKVIVKTKQVPVYIPVKLYRTTSSEIKQETTVVKVPVPIRKLSFAQLCMIILIVIVAAVAGYLSRRFRIF